MPPTPPPDSEDFRAADLILIVEQYMSLADSKKVYNAFIVAAEAHHGIFRKDGSPYITHPLEVARILADLRMDVDGICAALLHDVIEDTPSTKEELAARFGENVADLVDGVTKFGYESFANKQEALIATFRKMMGTMTRDSRVVLIKLADRLHNLSTMKAMPAKTRIKKAKESFDLYIPLARRMGMNKLRRKMQELAFEALHPWRATVLKRVMDDYIERNEEKHVAILDTITKAMQQQSLEATVMRWPKNLFRVYQRLSLKGEKLQDRTETLDLRVVVQDKMHCYQALGIIHQVYQPKLGAFEDFIAVPKVYGFQALQTTLLTPSQQVVTVQIQTEEMFHVAQYGIAAGWRDPKLLESSEISIKALQKWLKQVSEIHETDIDPLDFYQDMQADLFLHEIYITTPAGEVIVLAHNSSALDFAYAIHSEVGNTAHYALIDGKKAALKTKLHSGETVEIVTSEHVTPKVAWHDFVVTAKAKASIRSWVNSQKESGFIELGKQVLSQTLATHNLKLNSFSKEAMTEMLTALNFSNEKELWVALAKGTQCAKLITHRLMGELPSLSEKERRQPMLIKGTSGLVVNLQSCCHPISGDAITARLNSVDGLEIHRATCPVLISSSLTEDEEFRVSWAEGNKEQFKVPLEVRTANKIGILSSITSIISRLEINISGINLTNVKSPLDDEEAIIRFLIEVKNRQHLESIMDELKGSEGVTQVNRPF